MAVLIPSAPHRAAYENGDDDHAPFGGGADAPPLRLLFVAPYVPSPIRVRPFQIVRHLARLGHRVTVVALSDGFASNGALEELQGVCEAVHVVPHPAWRGAAQCALALPTTKPLWAAYCRSPQMARVLRRLVASGDFDAVHIEHLRAAHFARDLGNLPTVFDAVDCITALRRQMLDQSKKFGANRLLSWEEWAKLKKYEPRAYRAFDEIAVTSRHDGDALHALGGGNLPPLSVIPNGADLDYFAAAPWDDAEPGRIVFSGKMSYGANENAALFLGREIFPLVQKAHPDARLTIAGSSPGPSVLRLAETNPAITVTGYVDDLRPHLGAARVAVCPMRIGVGIQNKALEAMAVARPVVCSPLAARPLSGAAGGLRVATTADDFAREIGEWLQKPHAAKMAGLAARTYVEENHRWERTAEAFTGLYRRAMAKRSSVGSGSGRTR